MNDAPYQAIIQHIAVRAGQYDGMAMDIWDNPEISGMEQRSSAIHRQRLRTSGFAIQEYPEMAWSFMAEKGQGQPVIAFMGEYDALPGMSQACSPTQGPRQTANGKTGGTNNAGHACGHNLLGIGALAAAEALAAVLAAVLESTGLPGTVHYYGCPAEEAPGRIPLVKAGRFDDVDAALTGHPAGVNTAHRYATSANLAI